MQSVICLPEIKFKKCTYLSRLHCLCQLYPITAQKSCSPHRHLCEKTMWEAPGKGCRIWQLKELRYTETVNKPPQHPLIG